MGGSDRRGGEGGGWKEILKKPKKAKKTLAFRFRLCYYKQVAGRQRQTKENPGVAKFGIALEWGSRGLEFESQHSDHKRPEIVEISGLFATFFADGVLHWDKGNCPSTKNKSGGRSAHQAQRSPPQQPETEREPGKVACAS